eukprot:2120780-Prymnesium_polylepis.1
MVQPCVVEYDQVRRTPMERDYTKQLCNLANAIRKQQGEAEMLERVRTRDNGAVKCMTACLDPDHFEAFRDKLKLKQLQLRLLQLVVSLDRHEREHPDDLSAAISAFTRWHGERLQRLISSGRDSREGWMPKATELLEALPRVQHLSLIHI